MAYNGDKLKDGPKTWADFCDTKKFAGKRGMRKGARYNLEFALMADGVKSADVYKVLATKAGADRAFKKLTELKPSIQWWEAGAQPPQFLVAGDVVMSTAYNGRIDAANREGKNLKITWTGGIYDLDYWAIPKGTPNKDASLKFIAFASTPEAQAEYAKQHRLRPDQQQGAGQARRQGARQPADRAGQRQGRAAVQPQVLGRPGRGAGEALRLLGRAVGGLPLSPRERVGVRAAPRAHRPALIPTFPDAGEGGGPSRARAMSTLATPLPGIADARALQRSLGPRRAAPQAARLRADPAAAACSCC